MSSDKLQNFDGDSLLHSLLLVSKHFGINTNAESLTASLPLVDEKLTPELFVRAALREASSSEVKQVIEQVGGVYVERVEAMEHVKDMLIEYSDMKESDFELIDTESLVDQTKSSRSDQQSSLSSLENDKISLEVLAELEDSQNTEQLFSDSSPTQSNSQDYGSAQTSDNQVAIADGPSVINVLDSILGTIENNLVYDF